MEDNFEKLNLLLEQELCEFVDIPDGFTGGQDPAVKVKQSKTQIKAG